MTKTYTVDISVQLHVEVGGKDREEVGHHLNDELDAIQKDIENRLSVHKASTEITRVDDG